MVDNVSSVSQRVPCVATSKFFIQSVFLFMLSGLSATAIILEWGNVNVWTWFLLICVLQMLNLPTIELATMLCESFKSTHQPEILAQFP